MLRGRTQCRTGSTLGWTLAGTAGRSASRAQSRCRRGTDGSGVDGDHRRFRRVLATIKVGHLVCSIGRDPCIIRMRVAVRRKNLDLERNRRREPHASPCAMRIQFCSMPVAKMCLQARASSVPLASLFEILLDPNDRCAPNATKPMQRREEL